jgi:hypothetical protein
MVFASCEPAFHRAGEELGEVLLRDNYESEIKRLLGVAARKGCTHLVLDYVLWNSLPPGASERLKEFIRRVPPDAVISNPVAQHEPTFLEDGNLPDLRNEPLSWHIYIYRLNRFTAGT